jgi:5'-phosphate synthase pdxT subunit
VKIGVLALQGAIEPHRAALDALGETTVEVRTPGDLSAIDALILPGGESTTMSFLLDSSGLRAPLRQELADGLPTFGTCAGMILLAAEVLDGRADQESLCAIDISVRRNAFGRQRDSFEADLDIAGVGGGAFHAVFIRAPAVERVGAGVEVLASVGDRPVLCQEGSVLVSSFHPELSDDLRLHQRFLERI